MTSLIYNEIGLCAHTVWYYNINHSISNSEHNWEGLCNHLGRKAIFTLTPYNFAFRFRPWNLTWQSSAQFDVTIFCMICNCSLSETIHDSISQWSQLFCQVGSAHNTLIHFDFINFNLLSTIMSQLWHFLLVETENVTKLKNEYDIESTGYRYTKYDI